MIAIWTRFKALRARQRLSGTERFILEAVSSALSPAYRRVLECQLDAISNVERFDDGARVVFRYGKKFDSDCVFDLRCGRTKIADIEINYYKYVVRAEVWVDGGLLSGIEYPTPAFPGERDGLSLRKCNVLI